MLKKAATQSLSQETVNEELELNPKWRQGSITSTSFS